MCRVVTVDVVDLHANMLNDCAVNRESIIVLLFLYILVLRTSLLEDNIAYYITYGTIAFLTNSVVAVASTTTS